MTVQTEGENGSQRTRTDQLPRQAAMAVWPTPMHADGRGSAGVGKKELPNVVKQAAWPTPCADQARGTPEQQLQRKQKLRDAGSSIGVSVTDLNLVSQLAGWPTTTNRDASSNARHGYMIRGNPGTTLLDAARLVDSGQMQTGCTVEIKSGDRLNPAHSRWLIGLPTAWDECAVMVTPSSRKSRRK